MSSQLISPHDGGGATILPNDDIIVFGGAVGSSVLNTVERYNASQNLWASMAPMSEARFYPGFAQDNAGMIYAIGGQNMTTALSTVEKYNPNTDSWSYVAQLPRALGGIAAFSRNGEIWAVGGWAPGMVSDCYIYNPDNNTWRTNPQMYEGLVRAAPAVGLSGKAYLIGGQRFEGIASDHVAVLIPEPTTIGLLLFGLIGILRKRFA
jgi:N-acetylneuraminic acid mutarotase